MALIGSAHAQSRSTGIESHPGARPTTGSGSAGQRRGASPGDNPAAMMQRHLDQNARDQDAQARQRDAEELKRLQEENARLRDAERQQQQQRNSGSAAGRTSGAGGASGNEGDDPDGGTGGSAGSASFQRLNPDANHEGKGCAYFTKPAISEDGSSLNYYGEGAFVVYGKWMYKCKDKRWSNEGPASVWPKSDVERLKAEKLESSPLRSGAYFQKD